MHTDNTMKETILQALFRATITTLALARVCFERLRASKRGRTVCNVALAVTAAVLYTVIVYKVAERDTANDFERWKVEYAAEYTAQQEAAQEAARLSALPDPAVEQRKEEADTFAKLMAGLKLYDYGTDDFRTLAQCLYCRKANPQYPDTLIEIIEQPKQWPGYSDSNEVTQKEYNTALTILEELDAQEHPTVSNAFVYASFERDGITLRDTWEIGTRTKFWRYGE